MKKLLASILALAVIMNNSMPAINVFAKDVIKEKAAAIEREINSKLRLGEFALNKHPKFAQYNDQFKVSITSITGNGGEFKESVYSKAVDGDLKTHWETNTPNSFNHTNELTMEFDKVEEINRLAYTVRQDGGIGKGYPRSAKIYVSTEGVGNDFKLAGEVTANPVNHKTIEYRFDTVRAKRVKFVFVEADRDWASAAELWVYKEDKVMDTMANLFIDEKMNRVNPEYATEDKLNELEELAKQHPFYEEYKEDIANAKAILEGTKITSTTAKVSKLVGSGEEGEQAYKDMFMVPRENISNVECNGGTWGPHIIENMFDNNPSTMWESNTSNSDKYQNELTFIFDEIVELDRFAYLARDIRIGFPEEFEIYASNTSKGDTFQKVAVGSAKETNDFLQFKFEPTKFKRLKFKFNKIKGDRVYAAEIRFFKEDEFSEKMETLFANDKLTAVNEVFAKEGALDELEDEARKHPLYSTYKEDIDNAKALLAEGLIESVETSTKKVDYVNNTDYVNQFGISREKIKCISTNGGHYDKQKIENAIDGDQKTYWETNCSSDDNWKHEVTVDFKEDVVLDRIVLGARQSDRKGFLNEFEIYASATTRGDNFKLVGIAKGSTTTGLVEAKFNQTKFRRVKIKAIRSDQNWATLNEIMFFQEDEVYNKMNKLFTDNTMSAVSEDFAKEADFKALEDEAKQHPLYDSFKEDLDNAKHILNPQELKEGNASIKVVDYLDNEDYMSKFHVPHTEVKSITNNGGHWDRQVIGYAVDGDQKTYWETTTSNTDVRKNEVIVEFKETQTLDRIAYGARPSDGKGFIEAFEVYASETTKGETFHKVAKGTASYTKSLVEAKFNTTKFKRLKLVAVKANADWPTINELMFFKQDTVADNVKGMFTNSLMNELKPEFSRKEAIDALAKEVDVHPLKDELQEYIDRAREVLKAPENFKSNVFELERRGDSVKETEKRKMWSFRDWLPTGLAVKSEQKITVYVDAEPGEPLPYLVFKQMDTQNNGTIDLPLHHGKNEITIPRITGTTIRPGVPLSGVLYAVDPYTEKQQSRMPKIKIEGAVAYPHFVKGVDSDAEVMEELREYEKRREVDPQLPDVIDIFGERTLVNVKGSYALEWFTDNNKGPSYTAEKNDSVQKEAMNYWGFDNSSDLDSDYKYRYVSMVKYLDGGAFMNANIGITGFNVGSQGGALNCETGWGNMHEMGHNMDTRTISIVEVTNNMLPLHFQMINKQPARMSGDFDTKLYPKLTKKDYSQNEWYPSNSYADIQHIFPLWQLQMYDNTFWPRMQQYLRAHDIGGGTWDDKHETWAVVASEVLQLDLTEFFQRHGFRPRQETLDYMDKFPKPDKNLWYINDNVYLGERTPFKSEVSYDVKVKSSADSVSLYYSVDKANKPNTLGYEIFRDGELIGFTKNGRFTDTGANGSKNYKYTIKAYDNTLTADEGITVNSLQPNLTVEDNIIVKLNDDFDERDYVTALDPQDNPIDVKITSNVNTAKRGDYKVKYEVDSEYGVVSEEINVSVVSGFDYLSDREWDSVITGWGEASRNRDIKGRVNGEIKNFSKGIRYHADGNVTYDLGEHNYDYLDMNVGIDMNVASNNSSSVFFKVLADGKEVAKTEILGYHDDMEHIRVPLNDVKKLEIIVDKNGDYTIDNSVVVEPKLVRNSTKPEITIPNSIGVKVGDTVEDLVGKYSANDIEDGDITSRVEVKTPDIDFSKPGKHELVYTVTDSEGNTSTAIRKVAVYDKRDYKYVSDQNWKSASSGWETVQKDKSVSKGELGLVGESGREVKYTKGIGTHSNSSIIYDLTDMNVDQFTSWVGVDRYQAGRPSTIIFKVLVDDKEVYNSGLMRSQDKQKLVSVNLTGAKKLELIVNDGNDGIGSDHGDWADAKFYTVNEDRGYSSELVKLIDEAKKINAEEYTEESFKVLTDAIAKAEELIKDEDALTKKAIEAMVKEVQDAIDSLVGANLDAVVEIPDVYLRKALAKFLNKDNGFTTGDMLKVTELNLGNGVASLEGLQYAKNLVSIELEYNEIKDLRPLAKLKNLEKANFKNQFVPVGEVCVVDGTVTVNTEAYNRAGKNVATKVELVDNDGNVLDEKVVNGAIEVSLDVSNLEAGIYGINVAFEDDELSGILMNIATIK